MENTGSHSENLPATEEGGAGASAAPRQGFGCARLLVAAPSQAARKTAAWVAQDLRFSG